MANISLSQAVETLDKIIAQYQPGGTFVKSAMDLYERGKTKELAAQQQSLVGAGLAGTTKAATRGAAYEEEVGAPYRAGVEQTRTGALTQAMMAKAGYMQREQELSMTERLARERMEFEAEQSRLGRSSQEFLALSGQMGGDGTATARHPGELTIPSTAPTKLPTYSEWVGQGNVGTPTTYQAAMTRKQTQRPTAESPEYQAYRTKVTGMGATGTGIATPLEFGQIQTGLQEQYGTPTGVRAEQPGALATAWGKFKNFYF